MENCDGFYAAIAGLLAYPDGAFCQRLAHCRELLGHRRDKRGQSPTNLRSVPVPSTLRAVPANGDRPLFPAWSSFVYSKRVAFSFY